MILNLKIINNKQDVLLILDNRINDLKYIYLDKYENRKNYLSHVDSDHSYKINASDIYITNDNTKSIYKISSTTNLDTERFEGFYIITLVYNDGQIDVKPLYDLNELYCIRMKYIDPICNQCCEKARQSKLIKLMFKEVMLRNSIELGLVQDAINYYSDIIRPFCKNKNSININICSLKNRCNGCC